jgi:hypothetical protein
MSRQLSPEEVVELWTLVDENWQFVGNNTGANRLGFAALLKFENEGCRNHRSRATGTRAQVRAEYATCSRKKLWCPRAPRSSGWFSRS